MGLDMYFYYGDKDYSNEVLTYCNEEKINIPGLTEYYYMRKIDPIHDALLLLNQKEYPKSVFEYDTSTTKITKKTLINLCKLMQDEFRNETNPDKIYLLKEKISDLCSKSYKLLRENKYLYYYPWW